MTSPRTSLLLACGGSFLAFIDVTITNLAVPDLASDFDVGVTSLSWVVTLYTILFAALLAPAGRLADVIGRRRLFVAGTATFTVASLLAAIAPSLGVLLFARAVQGVGAALLMPASLAFVLADSPPARRPMAIGLWSASASAAAGPALGGVLVETVGWRSLFCINVPLGAWLVWRTLKLPRVAEQGGRLPDVLGTVLVAGGVGLLVLGVTEGQTWGWDSAATIASLASAVVLIVLALLRSAQVLAPAIETDLWTNRTYASANVVSLLFGAGLYASLLLGVLFLTEVWGYSELEAGLAMTPGAVASAAVGLSIGRMTRRPSPRLLVGVGALSMAASWIVVGVALTDDPSFLTLWLPAGVVLGAGMGAVSVGVSSAAALSVAPHRFAGATGLNIAARQVGGAFGVAVLAAVLDGRTAADGLVPFQNLYWLMAAVSVVAAVAGLRLVLYPPMAVAPAPAAVVTGGAR
jgi:EmrB/QacA subfamily drug resistance transporter